MRQYGHYPQTDHKESLVDGIVVLFPCLKVYRPGCRSSCCLYSRTTQEGFIEARLKHLRSGLTPSKRKRKNKKRTVTSPTNTPDESSKSIQFKVIILKIILQISKIISILYRFPGWQVILQRRQI